MTVLNNISGSTNADIIGNDSNPTLTIVNQNATGKALKLVGGSSATCAPLNLVASTASQAVFSVSGVFISSASFTVTMGSAFVIPVYHETEKVWGYISAFKNVPA